MTNSIECSAPDRFSPCPILALQAKEIVRVCCGWSHSLAISANGAMYSWGWGAYFQLGHGDTDNRISPCLVKGFGGDHLKVRSIAAGGWHSACLCENGQVYTFGWGEMGQLGHGDRLARDVPSLVEAVHAKDIACGSRHTVIVCSRHREDRLDQEMISRTVLLFGTVTEVSEPTIMNDDKSHPRSTGNYQTNELRTIGKDNLPLGPKVFEVPYPLSGRVVSGCCAWSFVLQPDPTC